MTGWTQVSPDARERRQDNAFVRQLLDTAPALIVLLDTEGHIRRVNRFFEELTGYRRGELFGREWFATFLPAEERARGRAAFRDAVAGRLRSGRVERIVLADGAFREVEWYERLIEDEAGGAWLLLLAGQDVTERLRAEAALRASEARLKEAQRIASLGSWELDLVTGALHWCDEIFRIFEIDPERFGASYEAFLATVHPEDREAVDRAYRTSVRDRTPYEITHRLLMRDGRVKFVTERCRTEYDAEGRPLRSIGTVLDVTERVLAEQALQRLNEELEERVAARTAELAAANRELETFNYLVAHDLKAPLRAIEAYGHLLQEDHGHALGDEARELLGKLRGAAQRMRVLIDDLLEYARTGQRPVQPTPVHLGELLGRLVAEREDEARGDGVTLRLAHAPEMQIVADGDGLALALRNLLDNALKFCRGVAGPEVEIGARRDAAAWLIWVRDNGIGFDMRYHDRIFDIFQRLNRAEDYPGTGVGLAIVKRAVERMGGRVWAQSAPGAGATFYLELPG